MGFQKGDKVTYVNYVTGNRYSAIVVKVGKREAEIDVWVVPDIPKKILGGRDVEKFGRVERMTVFLDRLVAERESGVRGLDYDVEVDGSVFLSGDCVVYIARIGELHEWKNVFSARVLWAISDCVEIDVLMNPGNDILEIRRIRVRPERLEMRTKEFYHRFDE